MSQDTELRFNPIRSESIATSLKLAWSHLQLCSGANFQIFVLKTENIQNNGKPVQNVICSYRMLISMKLQIK